MKQPTPPKGGTFCNAALAPLIARRYYVPCPIFFMLANLCQRFDRVFLFMDIVFVRHDKMPPPPNDNKDDAFTNATLAPLLALLCTFVLLPEAIKS